MRHRFRSCNESIDVLLSTWIGGYILHKMIKTKDLWGNLETET